MNWHYVEYPIMTLLTGGHIEWTAWLMNDIGEYNIDWVWSQECIETQLRQYVGFAREEDATAFKLRFAL